MSDDLAVWLRTTLDRVEQQTRNATRGPWHWAPAAPGGRAKLVLTGPEGPYGGVVLSVGASGDPSCYDADHIAFFDPKRVLRLVEATRRIVGEHRHYPVKDTVGCCYCALAPREMEIEPDGWCMTLRAAAMWLDDQPGYRESWRP